MLRVEIVCRDVGSGGAARATRRLADSFWQHPSDDVSVGLRTAFGKSTHDRHRSGLPGGVNRAMRLATRSLSHVKDVLPSRTGNLILHSRADVWTGLGHELNIGKTDVINLHWLGSDTISLGEIGRLKSAVVFTLHDMWLLNGAAHYSTDGRFRSSYSRESRPIGDTGIDWDRKVWLRKKQSLRTNCHLIAPSRWLAECANKSALVQNWPIHVIPNPLDVNFWAPLDRRAARSLLGLPQDGLVILFGAVGGKSQPIKGPDLLHDALARLPRYLGAERAAQVTVVVFGQRAGRLERDAPLPFIEHNLGVVSDDRILRAAYSAADVMVVPSRQDNLPQTACEASACETPVVAFDVGGLPDIVSDFISGRLVSPFDTEEMARAIAWVIEDEERNRQLGSSARQFAVNQFSSENVLSNYLEVWKEAARTNG